MTPAHDSTTAVSDGDRRRRPGNVDCIHRRRRRNRHTVLDVHCGQSNFAGSTFRHLQYIKKVTQND
jgi:hypothetical protein